MPAGPPPRSAELAALALGDPAPAWRELGFSVSEDGVAVGGVDIQLGAPGHGIVGWQLRGLGSDTPEIDGLPVTAPTGAKLTPRSHPNGAIGLDHIVVMTPDFDRTAAALAQAALPLRRVASRPDDSRMGFRRLGPAILEIVEARNADPGPARFWGLVVIVSDLEGLASQLGDRLGRIRGAVQPGRRIASLRPAASLQEAIAFMDPES